MPKRKLEINPKSKERLKELCNGKPLTQAMLSEKTGISQNTLSKIANGKAPMSDYVAQEIIKAVPGIRREWIMGYDDFKTEAERISAIIGKNCAREDLINSLISLHGYTVEDATFLLKVKAPQVEKGKDDKDDKDGKESFAAMMSITSPSGTVHFLSSKEFSDLLNSIDDYVEMQLLFRFRKLSDGAKEYWG